MKPQHDASIVNLPENQDPSPGNSKISLEQYLPKAIQKEMISAKKPLPELRGIDGGLEFQHKLSFQSIPFKEKLVEFDKKYTLGRFGYQQDDTLESSRLPVDSDLQGRTIPRVGLPSTTDQGTSCTLAMLLFYK